MQEKYKNVTVDEILKGCERAKDALIKEIGDRIDYHCQLANGTYDLPVSDPFMFDVWRMVVRLCLKEGKRRREKNVAVYCPRTLEDYTGHASGAIKLSNGMIWVGYWEVIPGIPKELIDDPEEIVGPLSILSNADGTMLETVETAIPTDVIIKMEEEGIKLGITGDHNLSKYHAIKIVELDIIVVTHDDWG